MTFYEKYETRLLWGWVVICLSMPALGLVLLLFKDEVKEMLNEIPVKEKGDEAE